MQETNWTIKSILEWTTHKFVQAKIPTPLLDAQLLLSNVLSLTKIQLYVNMDKPLSPEEKSHFREFVKKRLHGMPVAYILKEKYWYNLKLYVDERVLIPRPETESLLYFVLENAEHLKKEYCTIFDFCTGSGCLAIALAKKFPQAKVIAIDISPNALDVAKSNALSYETSNIHFIQADVTQNELYENLISNYGKADIIVANPPYVSENEWHNIDKSVKDFEPKLALVSDNNGLSIGTHIFNKIEKLSLLSKHGMFAMELSDKQPAKIYPKISKTIYAQHPIWDVPKNEWFSMRDLDEKERFLIKINN